MILRSSEESQEMVPNLSQPSQAKMIVRKKFKRNIPNCINECTSTAATIVIYQSLV